MFRAKLWGCLGAALGLVRGWAVAGLLLLRGWVAPALLLARFFAVK